MPIGMSEEHEALRSTVRRWMESRCPPAVPRSYLEAEAEVLPEWWSEFAEQGWLGIHVPEDAGGQGYGVPELAVVLEEAGRAVAPGPVLSTVVVSELLVRHAAEGSEPRRALRSMCDGSAPAAVALNAGVVEGRDAEGKLVLSGSLRPVWGAACAAYLLVPAELSGRSGRRLWCLVDSSEVEVEQLASLDPTRRACSVSLQDVEVPPDRQLGQLGENEVVAVATMLAAAEATGGLGWCLDTASAYAKVREQFGRPIGQFQAVKHRLADMLVDLEKASAATWDACRPAGESTEEALSAAVAAGLALDGYVEAAKSCIQLLGGIGFTWEHDAHLYLKRAVSMRQLLGGTDARRAEAARLAVGGARRSLAGEVLSALPAEEAARHRAVVSADAAELAALKGEEQRRRLVELGYVAPHWPAPWGRDAGPVEQLVIDDELSRAGVSRPNLAIGAWALPTIIAYGTEEQKQRWVDPTLLGEITWCQMFSEPGAGSDLASLSTKAVRVDGGWCLSGQKVWTSLAREADFAICLARTNPSAPKHSGITYFIVDMTSDGLDVRPLRELTGAAMFNEIFLSDVFVPDGSVIGDVDDGWRLARTTLANERVSMSGGTSFGGGLEAVLRLVGSAPNGQDPVVLDRLGALVSDAQTLALLGHRSTLRAVSGMDPGAESSVRKLLGVEHDQRVQEFGLDLLGPEGAVVDDQTARWSFGFLATRCLTIAGGTSEVQRNLIAERLLGLPRDPEPAR